MRFAHLVCNHVNFVAIRQNCVKKTRGMQPGSLCSNYFLSTHRQPCDEMNGLIFKFGIYRSVVLFSHPQCIGKSQSLMRFFCRKSRHKNAAHFLRRQMALIGYFYYIVLPALDYQEFYFSRFVFGMQFKLVNRIL